MNKTITDIKNKILKFQKENVEFFDKLEKKSINSFSYEPTIGHDNFLLVHNFGKEIVDIINSNFKNYKITTNDHKTITLIDNDSSDDKKNRFFQQYIKESLTSFSFGLFGISFNENIKDASEREILDLLYATNRTKNNIKIRSSIFVCKSCGENLFAELDLLNENFNVINEKCEFKDDDNSYSFEIKTKSNKYVIFNSLNSLLNQDLKDQIEKNIYSRIKETTLISKKEKIISSEEYAVHGYLYVYTDDCSPNVLKDKEGNISIERRFDCVCEHCDDCIDCDFCCNDIDDKDDYIDIGYVVTDFHGICGADYNDVESMLKEKNKTMSDLDNFVLIDVEPNTKYTIINDHYNSKYNKKRLLLIEKNNK